MQEHPSRFLMQVKFSCQQHGMLCLMHREQIQGKAMKIAFVVYYEYMNTQVMNLLKAQGIDYYTLWENVKGKGHDTEPHIGAGSFGRMNSALMIAFEDEAPLAALINAITDANAKVRRNDERIRLFQVPLERVV